MKKKTPLQESRTGRQRGRPKLDTRVEEVLSCAATMFSSRGFAAATLEEIGAELGMTRPGLYYYAKSKEDLLDQCYVWGFKKFMARLENELTEGTGREMLSGFFGIYSEVVCDDASRCFLASENHFLSPPRQKEAAKRMHEISEIAGELIDRGIVDGTITSCDRKYALTVLFGSFNALSKLYKRSGPSPFEMGQNLLEIILNGLVPRP